MKDFLIRYFIFMVLLLSLFVSGSIDSQDGLQYLSVSREIYYKHEPTAPTYGYGAENNWKNIHMSTYVGKDGKTYSFTGLGYSLTMLPAVTLTDVIYKIYNISPPINFPLESDWLILFTASFTNIFFAAGISVVIFLYLLLLDVNKKTAIYISTISLFATNLFAASKHINAHTMFCLFLFTAFYLLRMFAKTNNLKYLVYSGISYGIVIVTYNLTYLLAIPVLIIYYLMISNINLKNLDLKKIFRDVLYFSVGCIPFIVLQIWYDKTRAAYSLLATSYWVSGYTRDLKNLFPVTVIFEGIYGQLFSVGRSIFLYSPILLVPIIFWHKIRSKVIPEVVIFFLFLIIYILFYSTSFSDGGVAEGIQANWHGESSWGPRYLIPVIPFGIVVTGYIYQHIKKSAKIFIFVPLVIIGIYVELLGVIMPYQIKYHELDKKFFINQTQYTMYLYTNLLPRNGPVIMMSKKLVKLIKGYRQTVDKGNYNVKFYDGIDFPFNVGQERWRSLEEVGYISFDDKNSDIEKISFSLINHPIATEAASIAKFDVKLNGHKLEGGSDIKLTERKIIDFIPNKKYFKPIDNDLMLSVEYNPPLPTVDKPQFLGIIDVYINDRLINKESISVPFVSNLGEITTGKDYKYWGEENKDPWKVWDIHTQVYERTPDFWWIKPLYYWDFPKNIFKILLALNLLGIGFIVYSLKPFLKHTK